MNKQNIDFATWLAVLGLLANRELNTKQPGILLYLGIYNRGTDVQKAVELLTEG